MNRIAVGAVYRIEPFSTGQTCGKTAVGAVAGKATNPRIYGGFSDAAMQDSNLRPSGYEPSSAVTSNGLDRRIPPNHAVRSRGQARWFSVVCEHRGTPEGRGYGVHSEWWTP
jgi:hypothetical protein